MAKESVDVDLPPSHTANKNAINEHISKKWNIKWLRFNQCGQTKIFFPRINPGKSKKLLKLNCETFSTAVQWITGHCYLNRHEYICGNLDFKECRYCFLEEETSGPLITDYEVLSIERADCFQVTS